MSMIIAPYRFLSGAPTGWQTANEGPLTGSSTGWSNFSIRTFVSRYLLPAGATKFRVTFDATASVGLQIGKCFIGASRLNVFDVTPTQMFFSGNPDVLIPAGGSVLSDEVNLAYDGSRDICIAVYIPTTAAPNNVVGQRAGNLFMGSQHQGGDSVTTLGGTFARSVTQIRNITKVEAYAGGAWKNIFAAQDSTIGSSFANFTIRSKYDVGQFTRARPLIRLGLYGVASDMFIGNSAEGANPFDFFATPYRVSFGGANATPSEIHRYHTSDDFDFTLLDSSKPLLISYHNTGTFGSRLVAPPSGISSRYRSGNQAADVSWPSSTATSEFLGPGIIDEKY